MPYQTRRQSLLTSPTPTSSNTPTLKTLKKTKKRKRTQDINLTKKPLKKPRKQSNCSKPIFDNLKADQKEINQINFEEQICRVVDENEINPNNSKEINQIDFEGQVFRVGDYFYARLEILRDEEEDALGVCQICEKRDLNEVYNGFLTCNQCARMFHRTCLEQLNGIIVNEEINKINQNGTIISQANGCGSTYLHWTCPTCTECKAPGPAATLCERLVDGQECVHLAQIVGFVMEDDEQMVRLRWIFLANNKSSDVSSWVPKISLSDVPSHCKCVLLGTNSDVSNEPIATLIKNVQIVYEVQQFLELSVKDENVFLCIGEYKEQDEEQVVAMDDQYQGDNEQENSEDSYEDDEFDIRRERRQSLRMSITPQSRRRWSQGGEIRSSIIEKFDKVNFDDLLVGSFDKSEEHDYRKSNNNNSRLEKAKKNLTLNFHPEQLPCRDVEKQKIKDFINSAIGGKGGCLYVSGIPGTGKTATVREVVRVLKQEGLQFNFVEVNALKLPNPRAFYHVFCEQVCLINTTSAKAQQAIEDYLANAHLVSAQTGGQTTSIVLVDEIDMLITKNQQILYNLFDWPLRAYANISVISISNTMDLPERLLPRIASRLTNSRLIFSPYKSQDLETIIKYRLGQFVDLFEQNSIKLVARKVGTLAGDVRKAMELLKRATEFAMSEGRKVVSSSNVQSAIKELYADPYLQYISNASIVQKFLLASIIMQRSYGQDGDVESSSQKINSSKVQLLPVIQRVKNYLEHQRIKVNHDGIYTALMGLEYVGLLVINPKGARVQGIVRLNAAEENVVFMLKQDTSIPLFSSLSI